MRNLSTRARAERWMAAAEAQARHRADVDGYLGRWQQLCQEAARAERHVGLLLLLLLGLLAVACAVARPTPPAPPVHFEERPPLHRSTWYWE